MKHFMSRCWMDRLILILSQQVLIVSTLCPQTCTKMLTSFVSCIVSNAAFTPTKSAVNAASVCWYCTLALAAGWRWISCSLLDWGWSFLVATYLVEWKQVLPAQGVRHYFVP